MVDKSILVTQAEFARISGISRQAVTKAVKRGVVDKCQLTGKIDVKDAKNAAYIKECLSKRNKLEGTSVFRMVKHTFSEADENSELPTVDLPPSEQETPPPPEPEPEPEPEPPPKPRKPSIHEVLPPNTPVPVDLSLDDLDGFDITNMLKADVDKLKTIEAVETARLKNDALRKKLIDREMVQVVLGKIHTVDVQEFLAIPVKFAPHAAGLCGVADQEIIHQIEQDLIRELYKGLNHVKRIIDDFLDEIDAEVDDGEKKE